MEASCACGHAVRSGFGRAAGRDDAGTVRTAPADPGGVLDRVGGRLGRCGSLVQPELHLHAGSQGRCCYRVAQARRHPAERRAARGRAQRMGEERRWLDGVGRERVGGRLLLFDARRRSFPEGRRGLRHLPAQLRDHDLRQRVRPHRGRRLRRADRAQRLAHAGRELLFRRRWPRHGRRADRATVREAQRDRARRGDHLPLMTTAGLGGAWALLGLAVARPLAAQLPQADEAFRRGDYRAARAGYERELAADSLTVRALYRLAILDSWDGKLARSLARFARLRRLEPKDEDLQVSQAQVLAWTGDTRASEALYDSVLARSPRRADALAGRARAVAWSGDLNRAEHPWRAALEPFPDDPELLIGLAQTLYWEGQPTLAEAYAARARAVAPGDRTARELQRLVRAALRPEARTTVDGAGDSDDNAFVAQEGSLTTPLGDLRGTVHAGWRHATRLASAGTSYGGGGYIIAPLGTGVGMRSGLRARPGVPHEPVQRLLRTGPLLGHRGAPRLRLAAQPVGRSRGRGSGHPAGVQRGPPSDRVACGGRTVARVGRQQRDRSAGLDYEQRSCHVDRRGAVGKLPLPRARLEVHARALSGHVTHRVLARSCLEIIRRMY